MAGRKRPGLIQSVTLCWGLAIQPSQRGSRSQVWIRARHSRADDVKCGFTEVMEGARLQAPISAGFRAG